jgi:hypothetical protein
MMSARGNKRTTDRGSRKVALSLEEPTVFSCYRRVQILRAPVPAHPAYSVPTAKAVARCVPKVAPVSRKRSTCQTSVWYADHTLRSARVTSCTGDTGRNGMYDAAPGPISRVPQGLSVMLAA